MSLQHIQDKLTAFLKRQWSDAQDVTVTNVQSLQGGWSKQTVAFDAHVTRQGKTTVLPLILRANNPAEAAILPNSRKLEHELLGRLGSQTHIPVPRSYFVDNTGTFFDAESMIIERIPGITQVTAMFADPARADEAASCALHLVEIIAELHTTPLKKLNADGLLNDPLHINVRLDSWQHYMDDMCNRWINGYTSMAFDTLPVFYDAFLHMRSHKPRPLPLAVVHGELNPNNTLCRDGKIAAVIDWERAHVGDPREDLGWFKYFEQNLLGTKFMQSVRKDGGFLGHYNRLTGFDVTEKEVDYFLLFSHSDVAFDPYAAIKRRQEGKHEAILGTYLIYELMGAQALFSQVMNYPR